LKKQIFLIFLLFFLVLLGENCTRDKSPLSLGEENDIPKQVKVEIGTPVQLTKRGAGPDWSPDGKWIAYDDGDIFVWWDSCSTNP